MMAKIDIKNGVFYEKENFMEQITEAHRKGLFTDVTFTMSDNVKISTSRFMLACRSSYFADMFFGEAKSRKKVKTALERNCGSKTMRKLLDYIWYGTVKLSDMNFQSLVELLEVSNMMHLDSLFYGVGDYLESLVILKKVEFKDCLYLFEWFDLCSKYTEFLLTFIYQNLQEITKIPRFRELEADSIFHILKNGKNKLKMMDLFLAFTTWVEDKKDLKESEKSEMLSCFELENFTRSEIQNVVRKTNLFTEKEIFDVLEVKYEEIEKNLKSFMEQESNPPEALEERLACKRKAEQANMESKIIKKEVELPPADLSVKKEFDDKNGIDDYSTDNGHKKEEYFENGKYDEKVIFRCAICKSYFDSKYRIMLHWKSCTVSNHALLNKLLSKS